MGPRSFPRGLLNWHAYHWRHGSDNAGWRRFATGKGVQSLTNILKAYAAFDPEVAYCQGMNFLAGVLLTYLPSEADAYGALVLLMQQRGLRELYKQDLAWLQVRAQLPELASTCGGCECCCCRPGVGTCGGLYHNMRHLSMRSIAASGFQRGSCSAISSSPPPSLELQCCAL